MTVRMTATMKTARIDISGQFQAAVRKRIKGREAGDFLDGYSHLAESMVAAENALTALISCLSGQLRYWVRQSATSPVEGGALFLNWIGRANGWLEATTALHRDFLNRMRRVLPAERIADGAAKNPELPRLLYEANQHALAAAVCLVEDVRYLFSEVSFDSYRETAEKQGESLLHHAEETFRLLGQKRKLLKSLFAGTGSFSDGGEADAALLASLRKLEGKPALLPLTVGWVARIREALEEDEDSGSKKQPRIRVRIESPESPVSAVDPWLNEKVLGSGRKRKERSGDRPSGRWDE